MGILPLLAIGYLVTKAGAPGAPGGAVKSKTAAKAWPQSKGRVSKPSKPSPATKRRAASAAATAAKQTPHGRAAFAAVRFARKRA